MLIIDDYNNMIYDNSNIHEYVNHESLLNGSQYDYNGSISEIDTDDLLEDYSDVFKDRFYLYKKKWLEETSFHSNPRRKINNEFYKRIIAMQDIAIDLIFEDWNETNNHWFHALSEITGVNPVKYENIGYIDKMKNDWINWYEKQE